MTRAELLAALKSAKGPITELDKFYRYAPWYDTAQTGDPIWNDWGNALKGSLDAAISLVERVRSGWSWKVGVNENHQFPQVVMSRSYPTNKIVTVEAATPALALLIALLESLNPVSE